MKLGNAEPSTLRLGYVSGLAAFMLTCIFGDFLDSEWGYWSAAILVSFSRIYCPGGYYETEMENNVVEESLKVDSRPPVPAIAALAKE